MKNSYSKQDAYTEMMEFTKQYDSGEINEDNFLNDAEYMDYFDNFENAEDYDKLITQNKE